MNSKEEVLLCLSNVQIVETTYLKLHMSAHIVGAMYTCLKIVDVVVVIVTITPSTIANALSDLMDIRVYIMQKKIMAINCI